MEIRIRLKSVAVLRQGLVIAAIMAFLGGTITVRAAEKGYQRSVQAYPVPDVVLVDQDRRKVRLTELLDGSRVVLLDFIYGTCTTICPVLSAGFSNLQRKLGDEAGSVQLVSITIDPEHDTPEVMAAYLKRYRRRPGWDFLTGSRSDIDQVMRAFDAYVPDKMSHYPLTYLKGPGDDKWVRIYGLLSTSDLLAEYRKLEAATR